MLVVFLIFAAGQARGEPAQNGQVGKFIQAALRHYEALDYELALEQLMKAKEQATLTSDTVLIALCEGIVLADMNRGEEAAASFRTALFLDPAAKVPVEVSPKLEAEIARIREQAKSVAPKLPSRAKKPDARATIFVMNLGLGPGVERSDATALDAAIGARLGASGFDVLTSSDVQTLIGLQKGAASRVCADDTCLTDFARALGANLLLKGGLNRVGHALQLSLETLDLDRGQSLGRAVRLAPTTGDLLRQLPYSVADATGLPPPPPPSRVPALATMSGGAVLLLGGGIWGTLGLFEENALRLEQQRAIEGTMGTRASYAEARDRLLVQKTGGLAAAGVGAALVALGALLLPESVQTGDLSLSVGTSSVGVAGAFR